MTPEPPPLVSLEGITKSFDATAALGGVSLAIAPGEFVGLIGPNGAGKSTLIKILDGLYPPDAGTIRVSGEARRPGRDQVSGIGVVHQDLGLVETLTVTENLRLGHPPLRSVPPLLSAAKERDFCARALRLVGLPPEIAGRKLERLTVGERALVAIARTLAKGAALIVADEATSALSPRESRWLIDVLKGHARAGGAVLMVSHKMTEVLEAADRCVVLVDGTVRADASVGQIDLAAITALMAPVTAGQSADGGPAAARGAGPAAVDAARARRARRAEAALPAPASAVLALRDARTGAAGPFTLEVRPGEITGITGLVGSGLYELAMLASGRVKPTSGTVWRAPGTRVGLLPPDRAAQAGFPAESVAWNLTIGALHRWRRRAGLLNLTLEARQVRQTIADLDIRPPHPQARLTALSGGNQQKVLLGRMLLLSAGVLVLCEPTRGVDVHARAEIYQLIAVLAARSAGVLIISSDSEDLLALADRVGVVQGQSCTETWRTSQLSTEQMASLL